MLGSSRNLNIFAFCLSFSERGCGFVDWVCGFAHINETTPKEAETQSNISNAIVDMIRNIFLCLVLVVSVMAICLNLVSFRARFRLGWRGGKLDEGQKVEHLHWC